MTVTTPIIILPLDARPVCYQLTQQLASIGNFDILMPPASELGQLKQPANLSFIDIWLETRLRENPNSPIILSADMLLYGGLIAGRVNDYLLDALKLRLTNWFQKLGKRKVIIFSTILRIPNYNGDEEEPNYWQTHGKQLYDASYEAHKTGNKALAFKEIPEAIRSDFFTRRELHHQVNLLLINALKDKQIDYLTISQDDTGEYGLNVAEAQQYENLSSQENLPLVIQTGADELVATSLSRLLCEKLNQRPKLFIHYDPETCKTALAKFDGRPIETVINAQVTAAGGDICNNVHDAALTLWIHGPLAEMGDHCENNPKSNTQETDSFCATLSEHPTILVDIANANGADPEFIKNVIAQKPAWQNLYGYAGWNTPGNSTGSAIAMGILTYLSKQQNRFQESNWAQIILTRLLDDWAYQANARAQLRHTQQQPNTTALNETLQPYCKMLTTLFLMAKTKQAKFSFPCHRFFEIEVTLL